MERTRQQAAARIVLPDELQVGIEGKDGPWASPVVAAVSMPGVLKILAVGGLTKEEHVAASIYAAGLVATEGECFGAEHQAELAARSLAAAKVFLSVSAAARKQAAAEQAAEADPPPAEPAPGESKIFVPGE